VSSFLFSLSEVIGEPVSPEALVPLLETDALWETFRAGYQNVVREAIVGYRRFFSPSEKGSVLRLADCLAERVPSEQSIFLTKQSEYCGAVHLRLSVLLRHVMSIIQLDGDSLSALSIDHKEGILIDHNPDDPEQVYEIAVWGDRWPVLGRACEHSEG
jgi:hypothetical protein